MDAFNEERFRQRMDKALETVTTILETNKHPVFAGDLPHSYHDKYLLADYLTNITIACSYTVLEKLGLDTESLRQLVEWSKDRSVTLRLRSEESCALDRKETRDEDSRRKHVTTFKGFGGDKTKFTSKTVTKITEYFWNFGVSYELFAFRGNDPTDAVKLCSRTGDYTHHPHIRCISSSRQCCAWRHGLECVLVAQLY